MDLFCILLIIFTSSCVTLNTKSYEEPNISKEPLQSSCIQKEVQEAILNNSRKIFDTFNDNPEKYSFKIISDECHKKKFRINNSLIIIFKKPNDTSNEVYSSYLSSNTPDNLECFYKATRILNNLNKNYINKILNTAKSNSIWRWDDPHIGPQKWLNCKKTSQNDFYKSIGTMLHELNHENMSNNCLFNAFSSTKLCLSLSKDLPKRGIASYKSFNFSKKSVNEGYINFDKLYFQSLNESPILLFDELNSYIISAKIALELYSKNRNYLISTEGSRFNIHMFAMMAYTSKYLHIIKKDFPKLFEKNFIKNRKNFKILSLLLKRGETLYYKWKDTLKMKNDKFSESELFFYNEYQMYWKK